MTTQEPLRAVTDLFKSSWDAAPTGFASAPGRVNLIGEHTDYNDGYVLPMAINRRTWVAIGPSEAGSGLSLVSTRSDSADTVAGPPWAPTPGDSWVNYPVGVIDGIERHINTQVGALRIAVTSDVPMGSGLSSSAALEAAVGQAVADHLGIEIARPDLARICQRAEHEFAEVRCGIMDQMSSIMGNVILLDCRTLKVTPARLPSDVRVVILDSGIPRGLSQSAYNERRGQCESGVESLKERNPGITALRDVSSEMLEAGKDLLSEVVYRRCRHVVTEDERVLQAVDALDAADMNRFGMLMLQSHDSMRDDYEISLPDIDKLVGIASKHEGCYGARLTGAGFGGAAVALVRADAAEAFAATVVARYNEETGRDGSALLVAADEGARTER